VTPVDVSNNGVGDVDAETFLFVADKPTAADKQSKAAASEAVS